MRSPRHSDWTVPRCIFPGASCDHLRVPMTRSGSAKPLSRTRREHVTFYRWRECLEFPSRRRKCHFLKRDETVLSGPSHFRPRAPRAGRASWGKREERLRALLGLQLSQDLHSHMLSNDPFEELQTPQPLVPRHLQDWAEARERAQVAQVPRTPPAGDQRQNRSTEKVERLKDNQRGLSVVIYNRDCKMVN